MRRLALFFALAAACTLDPRGVIGKASMRVRVEGLEQRGVHLTVTARDASGRQLVKRADVLGKAQVEVLFEGGALLEGEVDLGAVLKDADGDELACGTARGQGGATEPAVLPLTAANDDLNCGGCGRVCAGAPHAARSCDPALAACGPLRCEAGWFDLNGDAADGCESACEAPSPEDSLAACADGVDNDCDGDTDCADGACAAGFVRGCTFGACAGEERWLCASNAWGACGATASLESTPAACRDGADNDCDGKTDCADDGCGGIAQSCSVQACVGEQLYVCASGSFGVCQVDELLEATLATCGDGLDNDCDGKSDCQDGVCVNDLFESTIALCSDGLDNDCDGKTDCQDPGCLDIKQACTGTDVCAAGVKTWLCSVRLFSLCTAYVPLPENASLLCADGLDNDCDGKKDCGDPECAGKSCAGGKQCCADGSCAKSCR